jgi:hypothetical protein
VAHILVWLSEQLSLCIIGWSQLVLLLLGEGDFGQRSVVDHAVEYVECAQQHPHLFRTPEVMLIFLYRNPKQKSWA